jgi:hypothetical protein
VDTYFRKSINFLKMVTTTFCEEDEMNTIGSYSHSEFLETVRTYSMDDGVFDMASVLEIVLAGIDNLVENATEQDFEGQERLTQEQADIFRHLFLRLMPEESTRSSGARK